MDADNEVEVLLVEDNPQDADLAMRTFRKGNLANNIHWVEDGEEALEFLFCRGRYANRARKRQPKVVLLDLKLPKVDGLEVLQAIKADEQTRSIPVVVVTSSRQDPDIDKAYALGANSYVVKPIDFDQFSNSMASLGYYWLLVNQPSHRETAT
jgi:two-component system response regulator